MIARIFVTIKSKNITQYKRMLVDVCYLFTMNLPFSTVDTSLLDKASNLGDGVRVSIRFRKFLSLLPCETRLPFSVRPQ